MKAHVIGTPEELAVKVKVSRNTIRRILKAEHATNLDHIQAIADAFGMDAWKLLHGRVDSTASGLEPPAAIVRHSSRGPTIPAVDRQFAKRNATRKP
jgi:transcriptional regulator with XRE-family HTH domain